MRHQWVIDVLLDLQSYATVNDLPQLAARIEDTLALARQEILSKPPGPIADEAADGGFDDPGGGDRGEVPPDLTGWNRKQTH